MVTASVDSNQNLILQAWTVGDTSADPVQLGPPANGGPVIQLSIAALDSQTVITATQIPTNNPSMPNENELVITTWGVSSAGVQMQYQYVPMVSGLPIQVAGTGGDVSIAAGTVRNFLIRFPPAAMSNRTAVTPIVVPTDSTLEVLYWTISSSGEISKPTVEIGTPNDLTYLTAACMLPGGVPMSVYNSGPYINVGWFGFTSPASASFPDPSIDNVAAAAAGDDFNVLNPLAQVHAYFITAALTDNGSPPSTTTRGSYQLKKWSYPVELPNP
ncbi:MAG: hypothetical protein ACLQT5_00885 [Steroidobacteraceae bacterium]